MTNRRHESDGDCEGCPLARRDFVKQAGLTALGALLLAGMPAELAAGVLPTPIAPLRRSGSNPTYPIPAQDGAQIDKENQVILVRWKDAVYAFNLSCPHQNTALHWHQDDGQFQCPKHHSKYQPDGTFISGRATRNMDRFTVTRNGNEIVVNVDAMHKSDVDAAGWGASVIHLTP